jgi:hypothetical protein
LIPRKESVTTENFDVYMAPLVEELLQLWEGVLAYDVLKDIGHREFTLRGVLMWTIHDYLGYGTVGGFAHQGYAGCPYCGPELGAKHSMELEKQIYRGTRRWLDPDHPYCSERMKCHFNVETEDRPRPRIVTMEEQIQCTVDYEAWKAAGNREGGMGDPSKEHGVKRLSIIPIFV